MSVSLVNFTKWLFNIRDYMLDYTSDCEYVVHKDRSRMTSDFNIGVLSNDEWDIVRALLDGLEDPIKWNHEKYVDSKEYDDDGTSSWYNYTYGYSITLYKYN